MTREEWSVFVLALAVTLLAALPAILASGTTWGAR